MTFCRSVEVACKSPQVYSVLKIGASDWISGTTENYHGLTWPVHFRAAPIADFPSTNFSVEFYLQASTLRRLHREFI